MNILLFLINKTKTDDFCCTVATVCIAVAVGFGFTALTSYNLINGEIEEIVRETREKEEEEPNAIQRRKKLRLDDSLFSEATKNWNDYDRDFTSKPQRREIVRNFIRTKRVMPCLP